MSENNYALVELYKGFIITMSGGTLSLNAYRSLMGLRMNLSAYGPADTQTLHEEIDEANDSGDIDYDDWQRAKSRDFSSILKSLSAPYPEYIMKLVRQKMGLEEWDDSRDDEIANMSHGEVFQRCLEWEGIIGYYYTIKSWIENIYGVKLDG